MNENHWIEQYRRRWPRGLVTYPQLLEDGPHPANWFLSEVGLPRGREPEWNFSGQLTRKVINGVVFRQFGTRGTFALLLKSNGTVWLERPHVSDPGLCNGSIEQFARCLTLATRGDNTLTREGLTANQFVALVRESYERIDTLAVSESSVWSIVLSDIEELERERTGKWD